jgi:hypothetical protein
MAMPLFYLKDSDRTLALSPSFWIYIATSVPLTVVILAYWRLMLYLNVFLSKLMTKGLATHEINILLT